MRLPRSLRMNPILLIDLSSIHFGALCCVALCLVVAPNPLLLISLNAIILSILTNAIVLKHLGFFSFSPWKVRLIQFAIGVTIFQFLAIFIKLITA